MEISKEKIKELREKTDVGVMECKQALREAKGNIEKAIDILMQKGKTMALKRAGRTVKQGLIESYVHLGSKIGVLVEINCETDFVARNSQFKEFAKDVAMQIAACGALFVSRDDIPSDVLKEEKARRNDVEEYVREVCLLEQPFIKDAKIKIQDCLTSVIAKTGENIVIRRFTRFQLGEELA